MEMNRSETIENKQKAVSMALLSIEKQFGKGSIMKLGDGRKLNMDQGAISTGSLSLDFATGIGGLPRGRISEIYGPESSGKTTIALYTIAQAQREGGVAAFIDAEHALDVVYARKLGVNTDDLLISQPDTGEQALEICRDSSAQRRRRCHRHRLGGGVGASSGARRGDGRFPYGTSSSPDVASAPKTHRLYLVSLDTCVHLHQPTAHEDRRDVRKSRNHHWRKRA